MKKFLALLTIVLVIFGYSVAHAVTVFQIQQGGTNNGSAPSANSLIWYDGVAGQYAATSTQPLYIGTFNATSTTATSTAANGINISAGCFAISGTCVGGGGGGGTPGGSDGQVQYNNSSAFGGSSSLFFDDTNNRLGVGTSSPYATLSAWGSGTGAGELFSLTNNASSTILSVLNNGDTNFMGTTSIDYLLSGAQTFDTDAGVLSWIDMAVSSSAADNTVESYTASLDGNPMLTIYGLADGSGGVDNRRVGIGTTSPFSTLTVTAGASATTTMTWGNPGDTSSKTCVNMKTNTGTDVSWYIVGTTMVIESNQCN